MKVLFNDYRNKITLNKIKDIICSNVTKKAFADYIFEPLKNENMETFTESYSITINHLSEFMNGNCDKNGKRQSVSTLRLWADKICIPLTYQKMLEKVSIYESLTPEQLRMFSELFLADKEKMPELFTMFIEQKINEKSYSQLILLLILWSIYGEDYIYLFSEIYTKKITVEPTKYPKLLQHIIPANPVFIGREELLNSIYEKISVGNHFVFLQGMGGIGKSECAKQYAQKYSSQYNTIVFAECTNSLMELLNDNTVFTMTPLSLLERIRYADGKDETEQEFYKRKLLYFRSAVDKKTLIILDNVDRYDPNLLDFLTGICHVIITTRWQSQLIYPIETICVEEIQDMQVCKNIFSAYYGKNIDSDMYVENIISYFTGHTLALELIAKQMKVSCISSEKMWNILENQKETTLSEGFLLSQHSKKELNMVNHIKQIFNISSLDSTEIYILLCLSLLPKEGIEKKLLKKLCGLSDYTAINNLVSCSWIRDLNENLSIHTLIKETVHVVHNPDLHSCEKFIKNFINEFSSFYCYYADYKKKTMILNIASNIYNLFPEPIIDFCEFYEWTELILSHCMQYDKSLRLSQKLYSLYKNFYGEFHFKTIRMLCRIACNERNCKSIDKGRILLEKGKERLEKLENKTNEVLQYISDVNVVLVGIYLEKYTESMDESLLDIIEKLCKEMISIRKSLIKIFDYGSEEYKMLNCVVAYSGLSRISTYRNRFHEAQNYIDIAIEEYMDSNLDYLLIYINDAKQEIAIKQGNDEEAISLLQIKNEKKEYYFGNKKNKNIDCWVNY